MNEITHIHLGRQPFTISVEAHQALKKYLHEIEAQVSEKEVVNEVELRISELLIERGAVGEKVVILDDVKFLKQQLGNPSDFSDDETTPLAADSEEKVARRLYRDTDHALIAGVSTGLASYFGLDPTLVRLLFVLLAIFSGGAGVLVYIVLWLAVPPAITASEKLQMQGKSVTLESLKDSVKNADLSTSAHKASSSFLAFVNSAFAFCIKLLGVAFIVSGIATLFGLVVIKTYMWLHHGQLFQENLFPVGIREQWLVISIMLFIGLGALFLLLGGIATFKRKWPVKSWVTGVLAGLFLITLAGALALTADVAPQVRDRYETTVHTTAVQHIQPFDNVVSTGDVDISYISSPMYGVNLHYAGQPDVSKIKVTVKNKTLYVDSTAFDNSKNCSMLCLFPHYNMTVEVYAPNIENFDTPPQSERFYPDIPAVPSPPEMN